MSYQRVEFLTGTERRRFYSRDEKSRLVEEAFRPGVMVTAAARRLGVLESLLYRWWRKLSVPVEAVVDDTGFLPVTMALDDRPTPSVQSQDGPRLTLTAELETALLKALVHLGRLEGSATKANTVSVGLLILMLCTSKVLMKLSSLLHRRRNIRAVLLRS